VVSQGPKIRLGQFARAIHREDGKIIDNDDVVSAWVPMRKGADAEKALEGLHKKVKELNDHILPPGVKIVPFIDRSDLLHFTTHTVLHNLTEGIVLVVIILFLFLGNARGAIIVALTMPFSLLFRRYVSPAQGHSRKPAVSWRAGFRDGRGWCGGDGGNIVRHLGHQENSLKTPMERIREAAHEVQRPVFYAIAIIITGLPADLHAATRRGALVQTHGLDGGIALLGALYSRCSSRRCFQVFSSPKVHASGTTQ